MAVTPIGNTGGTSIPGSQSISNAFGNIYSNMFGPTSPGPSSGIPGDPRSSTPPGTTGNLFGQPLTGGYSGGFGPFGSSPQPISGADNSVTAQQRAALNLMGVAAPTLLQQGGNLLNTGMGVTQGGLQMGETGFGTTQDALNMLNPLYSYWDAIRSGDPNALARAGGAQGANIAGQYQNIFNQVQQGALGPKGGFSSLALANLPQAQAAQIGNYLMGLGPAAAQQEAALGGQVADIGQLQAQIGQGVAGTGVNVGQLGTTLTGQGLQGLTNFADLALKKQQVNQGDPTALQQATGWLNFARGLV